LIWLFTKIIRRFLAVGLRVVRRLGEWRCGGVFSVELLRTQIAFRLSIHVIEYLLSLALLREAILWFVHKQWGLVLKEMLVLVFRTSLWSFPLTLHVALNKWVRVRAWGALELIRANDRLCVRSNHVWHIALGVWDQVVLVMRWVIVHFKFVVSNAFHCYCNIN
jgi:hypothetical protein